MFPFLNSMFKLYCADMLSHTLKHGRMFGTFCLGRTCYDASTRRGERRLDGANPNCQAGFIFSFAIKSLVSLEHNVILVY